MLRRLVCGLAVVALGSSLLFARQGTVVTKDGKTYEGDITEKGETVEITNVPGAAGPVGLRTANVKSITYPDQIARDVHTALQKLDRRDVKARMELARVAFQNHAYEASREALEQALMIEPGNREASDLLSQVNRRLQPAGQPATQPAAMPPATHPAATNPAARSTSGAFVAKREVTPAEVNRIRQIEMRKDESGAVQVQIDFETRRKFIAGYSEITPAEFNRLSPMRQAMLILSKGREDLWEGVHIRTDPPAVTEFKRPTVQHAILVGCAAASCHGGDKAGPFKLVSPAPNDPATYTNFLVLQKYSATIRKPGEDRGTERFLVDRQFPDQSLLLQYMLPQDVAETPHPKAAAFKPAVRSKADPRYRDILQWIQNLNPVAPDYHIDLTEPAPPKEAKDAGK